MIVTVGSGRAMSNERDDGLHFQSEDEQTNKRREEHNGPVDTAMWHV